MKKTFLPLEVSHLASPYKLLPDLIYLLSTCPHSSTYKSYIHRRMEKSNIKFTYSNVNN